MTRLRLLAGALGGGAVAFTLMACYGAPCSYDNCGSDYDGGGQGDDDASRDANKPDVQVGKKDAASDGSDDGSASSIGDAGDAG
jgi:hypothetical protein